MFWPAARGAARFPGSPDATAASARLAPLSSPAAALSDLQRCGLAAACCAQESVRLVGNVDARLGIHVGLASGAVVSLVVGGGPERRYEAFIAGDACDDMFAAVDAAGRNEIVASGRAFSVLRDAAAAVGGSAVGSALDRGFVALEAVDAGDFSFRPLPPPPPPTRRLAEAVAPLLPRAVVAAIDPRRRGACREMRRLAVLFVGIGGLEAGGSTRKADARLLESVQSAVLALLDACAAHGAVLRQFVNDDKGYVAVVCVGLAAAADDRASDGDVSARAVGVVAYLQRVHPSLFKASKCGITTGDCFCGPVRFFFPASEARRPRGGDGFSS